MPGTGQGSFKFDLAIIYHRSTSTRPRRSDRLGLWKEKIRGYAAMGELTLRTEVLSGEPLAAEASFDTCSDTVQPEMRHLLQVENEATGWKG